MEASTHVSERGSVIVKPLMLAPLLLGFGLLHAATNKICHFFLGVCVSNTPFRHTSSHPISAPNYILRVAVIAQVILHAPLLYAISNILGKIARFHSLVWKQVVLTSHVYV